MTDLQQDIFLKRPVSEKPGEDKCYIVEANGTHQEYLFADGEWHSPKMGGGEPESWLQPMKLVDVLGSLKVPVWVKASERLPEKKGRYFCRAHMYYYDKVVNVCLEWNKFWHIQKKDTVIEWLSEGNLSDLLSKVAEENEDLKRKLMSSELAVERLEKKLKLGTR